MITDTKMDLQTWNEKINILDSSFKELFDSVGQSYSTNPLTDEEKKSNKKKIEFIYKELIKLYEIYVEFKKEELIPTEMRIHSLVEDYCSLVVKGRDEKIEKIALGHVEVALDYHGIICEFSGSNYTARWEELESLLENSTFDNIYTYCSHIETRIEKFEKLFQNKEKVQDHELHSIVRYISEFKVEWPEVEKLIVSNADNSDICMSYIDATERKTRWAEAEPLILKSSLDDCETYLKNLNEFFRWEKYENKIKNRPNRLIAYAESIIQGRLPDELHNRMLMKKINGDARADYYFDFLKNIEDQVIKYLKSISDEERQEIYNKV